MIHSVYPAP